MSDAKVLNYRSPKTSKVRRRKGPPWLAISGICVALLPLLITVAYPVALVLPIGWDVTVWLDYTHTTPIETWIRSSGKHGRGVEFDTAYVQLNYIPYDMLEVNRKASTYQRFDENDVGPTQPFNRDTLYSEIRRARMGLEPAEAQRIADRVIEDFKRFSPDRLPPVFDPNTRYGGRAPATEYEMSRNYLFDESPEILPNPWVPWYAVYILPVWLVLSVLIVRGMVLRHSRQAEAERWAASAAAS